MPSDEFSFAQRLAAVEERIQNAAQRSGRARNSITLLAVSKKFPADDLRTAYECGLRQFGENYVQEFADKKPLLTDLKDARFHLIGHLQSNKARLACGLFETVQTVDSVKLLKRLDAAAGERGHAKTSVMIEVKLSPEESKNGAAPGELPALLEAAEGCAHLRLTGLMTMPPWSNDPEHSRPYFRQLAKLAGQSKLNELSMGMSGDLETAIEEGATMVRVGTALFGRRPKADVA